MSLEHKSPRSRLTITHHSLRNRLTLTSHRWPPEQVEIVFSGKRWRFDLPAVARLIRIGLTSEGHEMLALVADAYQISVADLMRLALEGEAAR